MTLDADRLRARADRDVAGARGLHGRLGGLRRPDHGAAARRARGATTPATGASARRSSSPTSSATCARTRRSTASTCRPRTGRASAWARTTLRARSASPELRALLALEVRRARGLFAEAEPAVAAAPGLRTDGCALRRRRLPARARPRRADRLRRARPAHRRAPVAAARRGARGAAPVTRRATLRGADRVPLAGRRGARRRADLRRELRRASRSRASWRAAAPTCSSSTATRSGSARRRPARRRRRGSRRWACARRSARSCRAWRSTPRTARPASACRGAGRRSTTGRSATSCGTSATPGSRSAKVERRVGRTIETDRGDPHRPAHRRRARLAPRPRAGAERAAARGDDLARAGGPSRRPRRRHRPRHLDRPLADPPRLRLVGAGRGGAAGRRRLLRAARPRQGRRPARSPAGSAWRPCATRATGSRTRCAPRSRTACSSRATAPGTASRSRARGSARRSTSASPAGASCAACSAEECTRGEALAAYGAFSAGHAPAFALALRLQRLIPALPPRVLTALLGVAGRERPCRRAFGWYLEQAHPRFAQAAPPRARAAAVT